jgi:hypothetical protein
MLPSSQFKDIAQIGVAPLVTLIIAVVGWIITTRYNNTQLRIARDKNSADVEVAKVNASMQFLQVLEKIPQTEPEKRAQLIAVSVPILPPDLGADLAVAQLDHDSGAVAGLFARYGKKVFPLVEQHLGRGPVFRTAEFVPDVEYDQLPTRLLEFLAARKLDLGLEDYLFLTEVHNQSVRTNAIINYFRFLRQKSDCSRQESVGFIKHTNLVKRTLDNPSVPNAVKDAVALSSGIAFLNGYGNNADEPLLETVASRFWNGLDVSAGEIPSEDSLAGYVYRHAFHYRVPSNSKVVALPTRTEISSELISRIQRIRQFAQLPWQNVRLMLYSYTVHTPRDTESPFVTFLEPDHSVQFYKLVLAWANTPRRRTDLGQELNSLSGTAMFRSVSRSKTAQRQWAELTIQFYESYYSRDWYPAKVIPEIIDEFSDLRPRVRAEWGVGLPHP